MLTVRRNHEKTLVYQERPCSVLSDRCRPWSPEKRRDGYTHHPSSSLFVGCAISPRSRTTRTLRGLIHLPPRCSLNDFVYITSAGMQNRDADCGGHMYTRTVRQIQQNTTVHYLVSPPRLLLTENPQAKAKVLTRLEVATR